MLRTFNVREIHYGTVEVDIPSDAVFREDIKDLVIAAINKGSVFWNSSEVTDITETK